MKAMQCDRAADLIGAYLDQELDADVRHAVAVHLGGCPTCAAAADEARRLSRQVAATGREPAPEYLTPDVSALLAKAAAETPSAPRAAATGSLRTRRGMLQAAVVMLACGVTAAATALLTLRTTEAAMLERDVAAAHVRSLLQEDPVQIASSEVHAVKPWFSGRLDFAPAVKDLAAEGFPLAGARLDYVGERRVAALVYRRRLHVVNVFLWPSIDGTDKALRELVHKGFNVVTWSKSGIAYWAISDLNMAELRLLQSQL